MALRICATATLRCQFIFVVRLLRWPTAILGYRGVPQLLLGEAADALLVRHLIFRIYHRCYVPAIDGHVVEVSQANIA